MKSQKYSSKEFIKKQEWERARKVLDRLNDDCLKEARERGRRVVELSDMNFLNGRLI